MDPEIKDQFESINSRFDKIDARFDNVKTFMVDNFISKDELDERLANLPTKEDFQNLVSAIDSYSKQVNDFNQEKVVLGERTIRVEDWAKKAAPKIGVEYNP